MLRKGNNRGYVRIVNGKPSGRVGIAPYISVSGGRRDPPLQHAMQAATRLFSYFREKKPTEKKKYKSDTFALDLYIHSSYQH